MKIKKNLYFKIMGLISIIICSIFVFVNFFIFESFKSRLIEQVPKSSVETAYSILEMYGKKVESNQLKIEEAQMQAKEEIAKLRLSDGSYFWIHNLDLKMISHPIKPELNNQDLKNIKTPDGSMLFADMNDVIRKNNGQGWHNYLWPKPKEESPKEKTSYIKLYKNWSWVIGSGMYVEDVEEQVRPFFIKIQLIIGTLFILFLILGHFISTSISKKLIKVSLEVSRTADNVNTVVSETQQNINSLSQVAIEQASAIEETAASVHEISAMASQNAKNSAEALNVSQMNNSITTEGKETLEHLENAINEIEKSINVMITGSIVELARTKWNFMPIYEKIKLL